MRRRLKGPCHLHSKVINGNMKLSLKAAIMPIGGALKLKGVSINKDKKKKKKRPREQSPDDDAVAVASTHNHKDDGEDGEDVPLALEKDDGLTETQRRHIARQKEREKKNIKSMVSKSHRERIDEFNQYLSVLTEHNDIPRVSAAGNG